MNGKTINTRTVIMPTSATSYDFKWEVAPNGNDWTTVQEGTAKKGPVGAAHHEKELEYAQVDRDDVLPRITILVLPVCDCRRRAENGRRKSQEATRGNDSDGLVSLLPADRAHAEAVAI